MQTFQFLTLLPLALAAPLLETRQAACPAPTSFQINGFTTFTPSPTQNPNGNSSVFFTFVDSTTGVTTSCSRTGPASGPGDANNFYPCNNTDVSFLFGGNGGAFDVKEKITCAEYVMNATTSFSSSSLLITSSSGTQETAIANSTSPALNCFPIEPPFPGGFGTECEFPPSAFDVFVTAIEKN